jgi:large subunit ribosomal protein L29
MIAKDLRERSTEDLVELLSATRRELFGNRMKNQLNQLTNTAQLRFARKDIARIETILSQRKSAAQTGSES